MKFLVTVTPRQVAPMPPGAIAEVLSAQRDWLKQKLEDGTLDCAYGFIGGGPPDRESLRVDRVPAALPRSIPCTSDVKE